MVGSGVVGVKGWWDLGIVGSRGWVGSRGDGV